MSMNIVTFATAVSVAAPKLWIVSLYYDTLTKDSFMANGMGVLQLLNPDQSSLVPVLGKRSGYEQGYSKKDSCAKLGFPWVNADNFVASSDLQLLPKCVSYLHLKLLSTMEAGDHVAALCEVVGTGVWNESRQAVVACTDNGAPTSLDPSTALYTGQLRQEGIL